MCINEEVVIFLKNEACAVIDAYKLIELSIKELEVQIEQNSCAKKYRKELSKEIEDVKFCKVNVDDQPELAMQFGIKSIPTLVFMKKSEKVDLSIGLLSKEELEETIRRLR